MKDSNMICQGTEPVGLFIEEKHKDRMQKAITWFKKCQKLITTKISKTRTTKQKEGKLKSNLSLNLTYIQILFNFWSKKEKDNSTKGKIKKDFIIFIKHYKINR